MLACFLWDCIEQKSTESPQLHEGKVWVRCSVQMMTGLFPFLSYDEIRYALKRLVKGAGAHKKGSSTRAALTAQTGTPLPSSDNF